ncbi:glycosyltransferase family 39 protein [Phaeobacter sp. HF9A]|uniref:ArnT family glycosyltransferase n=1 Tax=Phaeobacter sp. HF9A TaxID=2721561 RepID=UPI0014307E76|nr:glycosyltransferase family 39 protein [Phaeobacter sp. HF9A]NIZ13435.1 glycosyltransferase family 39 protein [Phaeobacter sp. HF9A]
MQHLDSALQRFAMRGRYLPQLALVLFTALMVLPGFFDLPPIDRDETRFSQASRQMVESGDLIDIRLGDGTRYKKPVGIYWLQSASVSLLGAEAHLNDVWAYRLPSALAAAVSVVLTYLIALRLMGAQAAFLAGALLASSFVFGAEARLAKTDSTLLATILACQWVLVRLWVGEHISRPVALLFWVALAASILIKGPLGPVVVGSTLVLLILHRRAIRWLAPLQPKLGLPLLLLLVLPWFIVITIRSDGAFWTESLGKDLLAKVGAGQESHGAPPGTYLLAMWVTFWPAAIFLPFAGAYVIRNLRRPEVVFCLAWILPTWLMFELAATKLVHYVLPTYPALAMLAAAGWLARKEATTQRLIFRVFLVGMLMLALLFPAASGWFSYDLGAGLSLWWGLGLLLGLGGVVLFWRMMSAPLHLLPIGALALLSLGMSVSLYAHLARVPQLWPSVALTQYAQAADLCSDPLLISTGYHEESLMLLNAAPVRFEADPLIAAQTLGQAPCGMAFVDAGIAPTFLQAAQETGLALTQIGEVTGFAIGGADEVDLTVYQTQ